MIQLAKGLRLDPDYIGGGTFALLAKKGWGKTYAMRVMAEEFAKARVPFVALDPMDAFWGLRAPADGKGGGGLEIPIFGGEHADVPLEPTAGRLMADLVVEEGLSMVLSIAHFGSRAAERRFAMDFLDQLYRTNRDLVHLLIDEADLFAPQKPQAGDQPLLGVTENIVRRGRNKGIGITLGTQRPAVLNKDVLTQVDGVIIGRMLGPQDRNAIDAWVGEHGDTKKGKAIKDELPDLATGECWVWIPEQGVLKKVKIRAAHTFDSSPTRKRTTRNRNFALADIDLSGIASKVEATVERAKAEDPKELRKQIKTQKAIINRLEEEDPVQAEPPEPVEVKVPVFHGQSDAAFQAVADSLSEKTTRLDDLVRNLREQIDRAEKIVNNGKPSSTPPRPSRPAPAPARPAPARREPRPEPATGDSEDLTGPQQRVLDALAWLSAVGFAQPSKIQVGFIAGYRVGKRVGGTFGNVLGELRSRGLLDYPSPGTVELSAAGAESAYAADIEQTPEGLQRAVHDRLNGPESRVLDVLIRSYPSPMSKQEVGEAAGYTVGPRIGGTFGNVLGKLRSLGLIDYPSPGEAVALPVLFLEQG